MTKLRPGTQAEWFGELAHEAWQRGQAELERGQPYVALRWLERAHRIAPDDLTVALSLAAARLACGNGGAAELFAFVADRSDAREALIGLAAAKLTSGDVDGAADAARRLLSGYALGAEEPAAIMREIAVANRLPGWCCVGSDGSIRVESLRASRVRVDIDGVPQEAKRPIRVPDGARSAVIATPDGSLLGSPIALDRIWRVEGFVKVQAGNLQGWAWRPRWPESAVPITMLGGDASSISVLAEQPLSQTSRPFARMRSFQVPLKQFCPGSIIHVLDPTRRNLIGSPVHSLAELGPNRSGPVSGPVQAEVIAGRARARRSPRRRIAIVIPAYRGLAQTRACLDAVAATMPAGTQVIVVDDATPEPELAAELDAREGARAIILIRNAANRGFPGAANVGLKAAIALSGPRDVVLLNSDTVVTPGWLERLRSAVHATTDIGSATPLSNDASIASYPRREGGNPMPQGRSLARLAALAARVGGDAPVVIPTAVGFCMYIRRECIDELGMFREDVFAQGYGEENDFCMRARHRGWRHVAVPSAYVAHVGGRSFAEAREHLLVRNLEELERLHPGYHALIAAFDAADPLAPARRRLDAGRWAGKRASPGAVVLITHDSGGGVERVVRRRCDDLRTAGVRAICTAARHR